MTPSYSGKEVLFLIPSLLKANTSSPSASPSGLPSKYILSHSTSSHGHYKYHSNPSYQHLPRATTPPPWFLLSLSSYNPPHIRQSGNSRHKSDHVTLLHKISQRFPTTLKSNKSYLWGPTWSGPVHLSDFISYSTPFPQLIMLLPCWPSFCSLNIPNSFYSRVSALAVPSA